MYVSCPDSNMPRRVWTARACSSLLAAIIANLWSLVPTGADLIWYFSDFTQLPLETMDSLYNFFHMCSSLSQHLETHLDMCKIRFTLCAFNEIQKYKFFLHPDLELLSSMFVDEPLSWSCRLLYLELEQRFAVYSPTMAVFVQGTKACVREPPWIWACA